VDKTKALMLHRIGDMARLQTDAIIISSCLGVVWVGLIGTYKMIVNSVSGYVNLIFNSVISSFGNLIATESREKQFQLFLVSNVLVQLLIFFLSSGMPGSVFLPNIRCD